MSFPRSKDTISTILRVTHDMLHRERAALTDENGHPLSTEQKHIVEWIDDNNQELLEIQPEHEFLPSWLQIVRRQEQVKRKAITATAITATLFWLLMAALFALCVSACGKPPAQPTPTVDPITFVCGKLTECALVNDDRESQRGCRICGAMYLELIRVDYHLTDSEIFDVLGNYDCEEASKSYVLRRALECISE